MAAYGGLVTLMNLMEQIKLYHDCNPIFIDNQLMQLECLREKVVYLQKFLKMYSNGGRTEGELLESEIVVAVHAAEDRIESHIVDDILARSTSNTETDFKVTFSQVLQEIIQCMDHIQKEAVLIEEKSTFKQPPVLTSVGSHVTPYIAKGPMMVLDRSLLDKIIEKLITVGQGNLELIPITGMGGIGKTTLARHVYDDPQIKEHFDKFGWITVSQDFNLQKALSGLLRIMGVKGNVDEDSPEKLGIMLHKHLQGHRYLIVTDDIWSLEAWDALRIYLPDDEKGSRVMITSRQLKLRDDDAYQMAFLDDDQSWSLLHRQVFGEESCPQDLMKTGKRIAKSCKGLPLSISVIGGVLAKSREKQYWEEIANDINASVISEEDERYFQILHTSYRYLPIHLKPCFLHLGIFPEDHKIRVSELEKLWVAEGFVEPREGKILEKVAHIYLEDLITRNLIHVDADMHDHAGDVQYCKIHDILRDLCLKEAKKHFLYATQVDKLNISQIFNSLRRIALHVNTKDVECSRINDELVSSAFIRSFICTFAFKPKPSFAVKLLRIWSVEQSYREEVLSELLNARYLDFGLSRKSPGFPRSISQLWSLQSIKSGYRPHTILPCEIWEMSQLRHVNIMMFRLEDPLGRNDKVVLENLQTLSRVVDFKCSEDVLAKIPYLRHLKVSYEDKLLLPEYLENLGRLEMLESFSCHFVHNFPREVTSRLKFSQTLKKLSLQLDYFSWEDIGKEIGMLPNLVKLKLSYCSQCSTQLGEIWNLEDDDDDDYDDDDTANGVKFPKLVYLKIVTEKLKRWTMDSGPFPNLEHLVLEQMKELEEIPSEIGDLINLRSITLRDCSKAAVESVEEIKERKSSSGYSNLVVTVE